jgi:type I restriction enzyme S subunit
MKFQSFKNARVVRSSWLEKGGRRLDCNPYMSGALEARDALERLSAPKMKLQEVTSAIFHAGREARHWVDSPAYGVPFLGSTDILAADLSSLPFLSKKQILRNPNFTLDFRCTLITRSGTIGRMAYVRQDMAGMACTEHVLRVVPDEAKLPPGYLYAFLSSKFGVPLVVAGTYGAIIQHIEPEHIANLPVPRFASNIELEIANLIDTAADFRSKASRQIDKITRDLECELDLQKDDLLAFSTHHTGFRVNASDIEATGRLEATYHDALVQEIERRISLIQHHKMSEVVDVVKPGMFKRIKVDSAEWGYGFITGSELFSNSPKPIYYVSPKTPNIQDCILDAYWLLIQAFGQIGGLIGRCMMTTPSLARCAATDLQIQLRFKKPFEAGYVCTFLTTFAGYRLLARTPIGGSIPHIHPQSVSDLIIPWPDESIRRKYGEPMVDAWLMRDKAVQLEDEARSKVETLIEGGQ